MSQRDCVVKMRGTNRVQLALNGWFAERFFESLS